MQRAARASGQPRVAPVPWFLVLFVVFAALNSFLPLPAPLSDALRRADLWFLCVGMAGVGLQTSVHEMREAGLRPIAVGVLQWAFLAAVSYALARWLCG
jgi:uncharacterized membrane protein YadS